MHRSARLQRELQMLSDDPPHGTSCWLVPDSNCELEAQLIGQEGTPYHRGLFKLSIHLPERYPFEPPKVKFLTPIYHPNIDTAGRICLDVLKSPPSGSWKPCHNISSVLRSLQLLLAEANPDDGLMADISHQYKHQRAEFLVEARRWTEKHAVPSTTTSLKEEKNGPLVSVFAAKRAGEESDLVKPKRLCLGNG